MNYDLKYLWLDTLSSGEYKKGRGQLRKGDEFCCLGVLCDLADPKGWSDDKHRGATTLPDASFMESIGLSEKVLLALADVNDRVDSFEQLCPIISYLVEVDDG